MAKQILVMIWSRVSTGKLHKHLTQYMVRSIFHTGKFSCYERRPVFFRHFAFLALPLASLK